MSKLLLALQYYGGDREQACELARLIADIEPSHSTAADFLFCCRWDSSHDADTVQQVSRKFNVRTMKSHQRGQGWPFGPNCLWFDLMTKLAERQLQNERPEYLAVLTFEADCVPLTRDWISRLAAEFRHRQVSVLGCKQPHPYEHINGNALFSCAPAFLQFVRKTGNCSPAWGWDVALAPKFAARGWADTPLIRSWYSRPSIDEASLVALRESGACFLHGIKDGSARRWARHNLAGPFTSSP